MARRLDDIVEAIRALSKEERTRLVTQLRHELQEDETPADATIDPGSIVGLFSDEPDLIDEVCASVMQSRERDPLRLSDG